MPFYRWMLRCFAPNSFCGEYGSEMQAVFERRWRDASLWVKPWIWLEAIADIILSGVAAHWDLLRQDLHYTFRSAAKAPAHTAVVIGVAAMGVAAATAVFTVADHVILRPLPFRQPDRLIKIYTDETAKGYVRVPPSPANYRDWKRMNRSFESIAAWKELSVNLSGVDEPLRVVGSGVNYELFPILGVAPALGRTFSAEEDRDGAAGTVVLSHSFWMRQFGGDRNVIGRQIALDGESTTIVGVMPAGFVFPRPDVRIWTPMRFDEDSFSDRNNAYLDVVGRLRPGVTIEKSAAEMSVVASNLQQQYPKENKDSNIRLIRMQDELPDRSRMILYILAGAAVFLVLIACSNLANLLLARAASRSKELSVRAALGAGRDRLVRQLLTESLVHAAIGGALGTALAAATVPLLSRLVPSFLPVPESPSVDLRVLLFAIAITAITGVGFGVLPALRATRLVLSVRNSVGHRRERTRRILVVVQVAGSLALVVSTGLLVRALTRLNDVQPGFVADGRLLFRTNLPFPKYLDTSTRERFYKHVIDSVRALPGVKTAASISFRPMGTFNGGIWPVVVPGETGSPHACARFATPSYFDSMGIPILRGRDFQTSDRPNTLPVAIVSESFVAEHWPGQNGIGRTFSIPFGGLHFTVVGVAGNVRFRGLERRSEPQMYFASSQMPDRSFVWFVPKDFVISTSLANPASLIPAIRRIVTQADVMQPVSDVQTLAEVLEADTATRRTQLWVISVFAFAAFLLAGTGIHGLLAFQVAQRTQEIGVRRALGANTGSIVTIIFAEAIALGVAGCVLGLAGSFVANRGIETFLLGVSKWDPATLAAAVGLAMLMTLTGAAMPAIRALRIDPSAALRSD